MTLTAIARLRIALPGYPDRLHLVVEQAHGSLQVLSLAELEEHLWCRQRQALARVDGLGLLHLGLDDDAPLGIGARTERGETIDDWAALLPELHATPAAPVAHPVQAACEAVHAR